MASPNATKSDVMAKLAKALPGMVNDFEDLCGLADEAGVLDLFAILGEMAEVVEKLQGWQAKAIEEDKLDALAEKEVDKFMEEAEQKMQEVLENGLFQGEQAEDTHLEMTYEDANGCGAEF